MATINGNNYDVAVNFDPSSDNKLAQGIWGGKVRVQVDEVTVNDASQDDVINIANIPQKATFLQAIIIHEDLGSGVTLQMGDSGDDDRYLAATAAATAGVIEARALTGVGHSVSADTTLFLKIGGADTTAADKDIKVITFYSLE